MISNEKIDDHTLAALAGEPKSFRDIFAIVQKSLFPSTIAWSSTSLGPIERFVKNSLYRLRSRGLVALASRRWGLS